MNIDNYLQKSLAEKLDIISKIEQIAKSEEDIIKLLSCFATDAEVEVRIRVAEELVFFESRDAELLLLNLLSDNNELVRVNACDSLGIVKSIESINALKERAKKDKSSLVRRYAALSIAEIAKNINLVDTRELIDFYETLLEKEKVTGVKICIYEALVKLGVDKYLDLIIKELENRLYRNRSTAVHSVTELISKENETEINNILRRILSTEKTKAVKSAIEEVLSK